MSSGLTSLQQALQAHLLNGDATVSGLIRPGGIGVARRLAIYHNAYRQRLLAALRDTFGHTLRYMGDTWFDAAAGQHIERHPSTHANLRDYGQGFEHTLAQQHPELGELPELACLDRGLRHAFDGADATPLTLADLAAVSPAQWAHIGFVLHPTFTRQRLHHNTLALWQALDDDRDPPPPLPLAEPGELLIWRRGHQPHFRSVSRWEAMALDALAEGLPFAQCLERVLQANDAAASTEVVGTLLRRWIEEELLVGITPGPA